MDLKSKLLRLKSAGPESKGPARDVQPGVVPGASGNAQPAVAPGASGDAQPGVAPGASGDAQPGVAPGASGDAQPGPRAPPAARLDGAPAEHAERLERLRRGLSALSSRHPVAPRTPSPLPGELREGAHGPVQAVDFLYPAQHRHGQAPLARALLAEPRLLGQLALDQALAGVELSRMLLLDTETTGLAGGTGTLPFLIGLGWFEEGRLRVRQLLLRRPGEEGPMLRELDEAISRSSLVVSYNGKSFDWPLLKNRFVMNRLTPPRLPPHLDLLHCARRVFRRRLSSMRLVGVEQAVLGHERRDDIDGAEIPERYFEFLRRGDGASLGPVVSHNAEDLAALAALLGALCDRFSAAHPQADPRDSLGFAQVAARSKDPERALVFARAAADGGPGGLACEALSLVAQLENRRGDPYRACRALEEALGNPGLRPSQLANLHLALAKAYEHRLGDPARALRHALKARAAETAAEHEKRIGRLEVRVARGQRSGLLGL